MDSIAYFLSILTLGIFAAAASIEALTRFVPDEMDRDYRK